MATETERADETQVKKTVTVVGYLSNQPGVSPRDVADMLDDGKDYFEEETKVSEKRYLRIGDLEKRIRDDDKWDMLQSKDIGEGELVVEEDEYTEYVNSLWDFKNGFLQDITYNMEVDLPLGLDFNRMYGKVKNSDGDTVIETIRLTDELPLVKPESELDPSDKSPFEDEGVEYPVVKYRFKVSASTSDRVDMLSDEIIRPFYEGLSKHENITRTRILDCEIETKEKGACFRV